MFEKAIQKLKTEKSKLTSEAKQSDIEYKSEIRRIDTAIQKFEEGMAALSPQNPIPRKSATREIENILAEHGVMHVRAITDELHRRGYSIALQSVSCALQTAAKKKKKYRRISPATFALLHTRKISAQSSAASI